MKEQEIQENMNKSIEATQRNFNTIRTGRANASLLDRISVEYYGAETPIKSLATSTIDEDVPVPSFAHEAETVIPIAETS